MLTDIFAQRYANITIWESYAEEPRRLIAQSFQLIGEIVPYYVGGAESESGKKFWSSIHDLIARELGVQELSPRAWGFYNPQQQWIGGVHPIVTVCENWMLQKFDGSVPADSFVKNRLSFLEIAFRKHGEIIAEANQQLPRRLEEAKTSPLIRTRNALIVPGSYEDGLKAMNATMNAAFKSAVEELNARFRQARCNLHYHNGFIQLQNDAFVANEIELPFWNLVSDQKWKNVDQDIKEAIDLRDTDGRDPAFYAARALESTIKIISEDLSLTTGKERGAHNFIDNLRRGRLIDAWEIDALKHFFSTVRNPLGHGPGSTDMPSLNTQQTTWAIENSMSWIKSLIIRSH